MSSVSSSPVRPLRIAAREAERFARQILVGNGVREEDAQIVAECLVDADLHGVDTHGCNRLPSYMERIRKGVLNPAAKMSIARPTPVVCQIDADNGFGFVAAQKGMNECIQAAAVYGIGMASVKHSNHFGMSASFVRQANHAGYMSLVFTNSSPALPVWGAKDKLMGVSPIACGAPGLNGNDFVLDMAPSIAARGKVYKALRRGEKIPLDWALDAQGLPTDDPAEALKGSMQAMAGPKGSALSIMMDVFSGAFSGSAFAGGVTNPYEPTKPADVGHFLVAIKPDLFMSMDEFRARIQHLYETVVGSQKRPDVDRVYFPGEIEELQAKKRTEEGIPWVQAEIDALNSEADKVGVSYLSPM